MKKLLMATAAAALSAGTASADSHAVKIGIILGFTGPIESLTPHMAAGAELAMSEVSESGNLLDGMKVEPVRADSTCIDSGAATAAAERLITAEGIKGIMGADCSGVTGAILSNAALPNGMVMISPSATSPALSTAEDDGLFFRTSPSDARQGVVMTNVLMDRGIDEGRADLHQQRLRQGPRGCLPGRLRRGRRHRHHLRRARGRQGRLLRRGRRARLRGGENGLSSLATWTRAAAASCAQRSTPGLSSRSTSPTA